MGSNYSAPKSGLKMTKIDRKLTSKIGAKIWLKFDAKIEYKILNYLRVIGSTFIDF
jgi:hypothetical protein